MPEKEILIRLVIGYLCFLTTTECQPDTIPAGSGGFRMPSVSDILQQTDNLMRSLQGVQPGGQRDTSANSPQVSEPVQMTDIRGNAPPPPIGTHVDMPGEHGNNNDFPVVHRGHLPIGTSQGRGGINNINNIAQGSIVGTQTDNAFSSQSGINIGPSNIPPRGSVFTGSTVHHGQTELAINPNSFVDLAMQLNGGISNDGGRGNRGSPPLNSVSMGSHVVGTAHIVVPGMHGNTQDHAVVHNAPASGDIIVDLPNQHGNTLSVPVVHRPDTSIGLETNESPTFGVLGGSAGGGFIGSHIVGSTHVDAPGLHGNTQDHAVVHTDTVSSSGPGIHVDLPNQHGNALNVPVVHQPDSPSAIGLGKNVSPTFDVLDGSTGNGFMGSQFLGSSHVDAPGLHGNTQDHAVVHTDTISSSGPVIHVDLPNQHGNTLNVPVVHRPDSPSAIGLGTNVSPTFDVLGGSTGSGFIGSQFVGSTHVDAPGLHGNTQDHAVVHTDKVSSSGPGIHVDLPNQHGNALNVPVVHRPDRHSAIGLGTHVFPTLGGSTGGDFIGSQVVDSAHVKGIPEQSVIIPGLSEVPAASTGQLHVPGSINVLEHGSGGRRLNINNWGNLPGRNIPSPDIQAELLRNMQINRPNPSGLIGSLLETMGPIVDSSGPVEAFISPRGRTSDPGISTGAGHNIGINTGLGWDRNINRHGSIGAVGSITGSSGGYHGRVRATLDSGRGQQQSNHQIHQGALLGNVRRTVANVGSGMGGGSGGLLGTLLGTVMDKGNGANAAKINETPVTTKSLSGLTYVNSLIRQIRNG